MTAATARGALFDLGSVLVRVDIDDVEQLAADVGAALDDFVDVLVGDYAADSAGIVLQMDGSDLSAAGVTGVLEVSGLCVQMLDEVLAAYLQKDAARARQAARLDDEIDSRHDAGDGNSY